MSTHNIGFYEEISKIITYLNISSNISLVKPGRKLKNFGYIFSCVCECVVRFNIIFNKHDGVWFEQGAQCWLNSNFYRAASLWYHVPKTIRYHPKSHYTDTGVTSHSPTLKILVPGQVQLVPLITTGISQPGIKPVPPALSGHCTYSLLHY